MVDQNSEAHKQVAPNTKQSPRQSATASDTGESSTHAGQSTDSRVVTDGGFENRSSHEIGRSGMVRQYSSCGTLKAYRSDDGEHHIVVANGCNMSSQLERRVPATRDRVVPGQKLWTIPDNWVKRLHSKRDAFSYGMFYIPDSEIWVKLAIPKKDHIIDAFYHVKKVGAISADYDGEIAASSAVFDLADEVAAKNKTALAEGIRSAGRNWDDIKRQFDYTIDYWVYDDLSDLFKLQVNNLDEDWMYERHDWLLDPYALMDECDLPDDVSGKDVAFRLKSEDLIPSFYRLQFSIDDSEIDLSYYVRALVESGCSPIEAVDYYMTTVEDRSQSQWADERSVDESTVSDNVECVENELDK